MSGFSGLKIQGAILTETTLSALSRDDKIVLIAETIADHYTLKVISDIGLPADHARFVSGVLGWDPVCADAKRLRILLEGLDEESQAQYVDEALWRTRRAISRFSSLASNSDEYFWFMVEQIHREEGKDRLEKLSGTVRELALELKVAA